MSLCVFVSASGHQTTWSLISNTLLLLLSHPGRDGTPGAPPALLEPAIEEALRYGRHCRSERESPVRISSCAAAGSRRAPS